MKDTTRNMLVALCDLLLIAAAAWAMASLLRTLG